MNLKQAHKRKPARTAICNSGRAFSTSTFGLCAERAENLSLSRFIARPTRQSAGEASLLYFLAELNEFSNLGKGPGTMKIPYAKKWQKETDKLRQIALDCDLTEELKWGKPCFTFLKKNVAIVIPLK